ncbi:polysaccharide lyase [Pelagicoccus sp. NFK12]|uniref:Polysaccharide lyase n=1 Tax=Pelagicoccus enzymogenes TaxID=2773457 RepID=A0A927F705_9BACT|nr:polysaccharide lyase [Pelagicoccus enzymogenes]MBD5779140.1 polysaccharide lyase [Pelagicoccus enzymogenes]
MKQKHPSLLQGPVGTISKQARAAAGAAMALTLAAWGGAASVTPEPGQIPPHPVRMEKIVPAFPGAWGGGMFTTGGRGGRAIAVTNLNDSGPGSLRAAIEAEGPRTVVFRVAGIIELESNLDIDNPDITIAGQSAPGDGICIKNHSLNINTRNVILRHLRVRRGDPEGGQGSDNIGGNPDSDIIVDHCSVSWGRDEGISLYRHMKLMPDGSRVKYPVKNLTIQWVVSSEGLGPGHEFGGTWGGEDSTFHHNLFACNTGRNPSIGMSGRFDYRNNVIYNWSHRTMDGGDETSEINAINNYYKAGPATNQNMRETIARVSPGVRNMYSPGSAWADGDWYPQAEKRPGKWYVAGNIVEGSDRVTADNWKGMQVDAELERLARVNTPFVGWPVRQETAAEAYESVLAKVGATLPRRDAVDTRVVNMVRNNEVMVRDGILRNPDEVGGYPEFTYSRKEVPADRDGDGMPDRWEKANGLDAKDAADGALDTDGDGYTNLEEFLNGTDPQEFIDYLNLGNNVDTIS